MLTAVTLVDKHINAAVRCKDEAIYKNGVPMDILIQDLRELRESIAALRAEARTLVDAPEISIKPMRLTDGRCDYFVSINHGDREVTPHVFRERFKAEYHVALYRWLFGQGAKPDIMEFNKEDWPAREYTDEERRAFAAPSDKIMETLRFYANEKNWTAGRWPEEPEDIVEGLICIDKQQEDGGAVSFADCGDRARAALEAAPQQAEPVEPALGVTEALRHGRALVSAFLRYFNPNDLPEDSSQQWQQLEHWLKTTAALATAPQGSGGEK